MVRLSKTINSLFSQHELPSVVVALTKIPELQANVGDKFTFSNGVWQGTGNIAVMAHALRSLIKQRKMKGCKNGKNSFLWMDNSKHSLLRN